MFAALGIAAFSPRSPACKAAGVPVFSPHGLRQRRATLWHLQGVPAVEAAAWLGHSPHEHIGTHATLVDRDELDYPNLLRRDRAVRTPVHPSSEKHAVWQECSGPPGATSFAA